MALSARTHYSPAERISDSVVHVAGLVAVTGAVPVLVLLTVMLRGDAASVVGTSVYGVTLVAMILCSALYNMIARPEWGWLLQRLDHSAIYLKIAGTYTPFAMISGQGLLLTGVLWMAALGGVVIKAISPARFRLAALALYLAMGWAGVVAGGEMLAALPVPVVALMVAGGLLYTLGFVFYLWDRLPFHYTIWHIFVLAASMVFYAAVVVQVVTG